MEEFVTDEESKVNAIDVETIEVEESKVNAIDVESVENAKYLNEDKTLVVADVKFSDFNDVLPYAFTKNENERAEAVFDFINNNDIEIQDYVAPVVDIEDVRNAKLSEISRIAGSFEQSKCEGMYIDSSLGFRINADRRSQQNIEGLIKVLGDNKTMFKLYGNEFRELGVDDLNILIVECIQNGLNLYSQKFAMQAQVMGLKTIEEIENFEVKFEMTDFTI